MSEVAPKAVMAKVTLRLIPFIFLLYVVNILDRVNIGFARLRMLDDLGMSEQSYAFGAGLFYVSYFLFEVPSNLILCRTGARRWISRILISWGIISCAMALVTGPLSFYLLRLLLGCAEAGFFPGIILYLTYWFPARQRARAVSRFMIGSPAAAIISLPISGLILDHFHLVAGLSGWQWLFIIEGAPAILLGIIVLYYLTDRPEQAAWLTSEERLWLTDRLEHEEQQTVQQHQGGWVRSLSEPRLWILIGIYFTVAAGTNSFGFYLPRLVETRFPGHDYLTIGLLSALPNICAITVMILVGAHSDRTGERRWHVGLAAVTAGLGWLLSAWTTSPVVSLAGLAIAHAGMMSMLAPFWSMSTGFLKGTAAAGGIAFINSVGNLGGFTGPYLLGQSQTHTNNFAIGLTALACLLFAGGVLSLCVRHQPELDFETVADVNPDETNPGISEAICTAESLAKDN